jgi:5-methylcytosine-specific restriction endonuclease McrA
METLKIYWHPEYIGHSAKMVITRIYDLPSLALFYKFGRLPLEFVGNSRVLAIRVQDLWDWNVDEAGNCYCMNPECGVPLRLTPNPLLKTFCSEKCEKRFKTIFGSRWHTWGEYRYWVLLRDDKKCVRCSVDLKNRSDYVCDHIIPLFKGGKDWWEDPEMTNFQTLCSKCNREKTASDLAKPKKAKEKAKIVSLAMVFEKPIDYQLDKFCS